jgi:hypothetical protein
VSEGGGDAVDAVIREASVTCSKGVSLHVAPSAGAGGWILVDAGSAQRIYEVLPGASREIVMPVVDGRFPQLCSEGDGALHLFSHQNGEGHDRVSYATLSGATTWFIDEIVTSKTVGIGACNAGAAAFVIDDEAARPTLYTRKEDGKWAVAPLDAPGAKVAGQASALAIDRDGKTSFFHWSAGGGGVATINVTRAGEGTALVGSLPVDSADRPELLLRVAPSSAGGAFAVAHRRDEVHVFVPNDGGGFGDVAVPLPAAVPVTGCDPNTNTACTETGTGVVAGLGSIVAEAAGSRWVGFVLAKIDRTFRVVTLPAGSFRELEADRSTYELLLARVDGATAEVRFRRAIPSPLTFQLRALGDRIVAVAGGNSAAEGGTRYLEIDAKKL